MRQILKVISLFLAIVSGLALATDKDDEYLPFARLSDNYELRSRKQNYDEFSFPTSITKKLNVEGQKTIIEYNYKRSEANSSRLEFKRHFEGLIRKVGGEIVYAGNTEEYRFAVSFNFPRNGKITWGLASTSDSEEIRYYRLVFVETGAAWGGGLASTLVVTPKPAPAEPAPAPKAAAAAPVAETAPQWNGGDWKEVNRGGCDVPDVRRSKVAVPDPDYCDATMSGKVVICNADKGGGFYKNVTPKQCKEGRLQGRMYVCTGN